MSGHASGPDLRDQIAETLLKWMNEPDQGETLPELAAGMADAMMTAVQPTIDRLRGDLGRANDALALAQQGGRHDLSGFRVRDRLRQAEAALESERERGRSWADKVIQVQAERDTILAIVSAWCIEANNIGGVDATDLAWRLEEAGHALPEGEGE